MEKEIKDKIGDMLKEGTIKYFIGYEKGTNPFFARPFLFNDSKSVEKLNFSVLSIGNLVRYVIEDRKKVLPPKTEPDRRPIGLVVKGCDSRAINVLIQENYVQKKDLYIVGMPCNGVVDPKKAEELWYSRKDEDTVEGLEISDRGMFQNGKKIAEFDEIIAEKCKFCMYPNPLVYDDLLWDMVDERDKDIRNKKYQKVEEYEKLSAQDRLDFWKKELSKCIRCYACKNVCPMCYCEECTLAKDKLQPLPPEQKSKDVLWVGKEANLRNNLAYHIDRAMHLAGRCTDCGECERACPVDIPLRLLYNKVEKDIFELFGYEAGTAIEEKPVLCTYLPEEIRKDEPLFEEVQ